ncbi:germ cell-specific gene 1-like protein 2 [Arapaima gigas]
MGMGHHRRASLALTLNLVALLFAVSALTTSYWCEGTRKVVKPFCTGPAKLKQSFCIRFNSSDLNDSRLVQYVWETGEDKFLMRKFHTGIWFSCEQNVNLIGKKRRTTPDARSHHLQVNSASRLYNTNREMQNKDQQDGVKRQNFSENANSRTAADVELQQQNTR